MMTRKIRALIIIAVLLMNKVLTADKCNEHYILRHKWINGTERQTICCKKVPKNCQPGFYVKKCTTDLGVDECTPCPGTSWIVDETNSTSVHDCVQYSCGTGAKRIDYLPKSGCNSPCICDLEQNYFGYDSCKCDLFEGTCPDGETLTMNGTCLPFEYAEKVNDMRPIKDVVHIPIINKPKVNGTKNNNTNQSQNDFQIGKWIITGASVIGLIVIALSCKILSCKSNVKANQRDIENQSNQSKGSRSHSTSTDSGVSLTTHSSSSAVDQPEEFVPLNSSEQYPLQEQTAVQKTNQQYIPIHQESDSPDSSQRLFDSESKDQRTTENQTIIDENCLNLSQDISKEQSAFKEQSHIGSYLVDQNLNTEFKQNGKQVATVLPFSHENDMAVKEMDRLLHAAYEGIGTESTSTGEIIQQNRPVSNNIVPSQRHYTRGYIDVQHSFGSRLQFSNSLGDISND